MKFIAGAIFVFMCLTGFSQTPERVVKSFSVPHGWKSRLVRDTDYLPSFGRKHVAIWEFKCNDGQTQAIWFYVFQYTREDSMELQQKATLYYTLSSCLLAANEDIKENFLSFNKGDYFFVERMCPCYTKGNPNCKKLVDRLMEWINKKEEPADKKGL